MYSNNALKTAEKHVFSTESFTADLVLAMVNMGYSLEKIYTLHSCYGIKPNTIFSSSPDYVIIDYIRLTEKRPLFIGFDGGSSAGKTYFVKKLLKGLDDHSLSYHILTMDDYVIDREKRMPAGENYPDMKKWFKLDQVSEDLKKIKNGERTLFIPTYDHKTGREGKKRKCYVGKKDVVIVEGMYSLNERTRRCLDLTIVIHADSDIRLKRELNRNCNGRNESLEFIKERFILASDPSYRKHSREVNKYADIIVDNSDCNTPRIIFLSEEIKTRLKLSECALSRR